MFELIEIKETLNKVRNATLLNGVNLPKAVEDSVLRSLVEIEQLIKDSKKEPKINVMKIACVYDGSSDGGVCHRVGFQGVTEIRISKLGEAYRVLIYRNEKLFEDIPLNYLTVQYEQ